MKQRRHENKAIVRAVDGFAGEKAQERIKAFATHYNASANTTAMHYGGHIRHPDDKAKMLEVIEAQILEIKSLEEKYEKLVKAIKEKAK